MPSIRLLVLLLFAVIVRTVVKWTKSNNLFGRKGKKLISSIISSTFLDFSRSPLLNRPPPVIRPVVTRHGWSLRVKCFSRRPQGRRDTASHFRVYLSMQERASSSPPFALSSLPPLLSYPLFNLHILFFSPIPRSLCERGEMIGKIAFVYPPFFFFFYR